jgi:hypothetical protein
MESFDRQFGSLNPKAPATLSEFAFLVGEFDCEARIHLDGGQLQNFRAKWSGRFILDGYAIADEYRMFDATGVLLVLGMNFRTYDSARGAWNLRWLDGFSGAWTNLAAEEFGGVTIAAKSISYMFREPMAGHHLTRATYIRNSPTHFTWRAEKSENGDDWAEFMVLEAKRLAPDPSLQSNL